jgi:glycolate oxidase subunit GlcD
MGLAEELTAIVGPDGVVTRPGELFTYDCDAYTIEKSMPAAVALPTTTEQVSRICRLAARLSLPVVPRGAGTGLSGGAVAVEGGIIVCVSRMNRILEVDLPSRRIRAQAGAVSLALSRAVDGAGFFFAPDPSSQAACTIGGNVAEDAGGMHTMRYGVTAHHVTGLEIVLPEGEVVRLGGEASEAHGYDLVGLVVGSEGTFGIVTEVTAVLTRQPEAVATILADFRSVDDATRAVTAVIAAGLQPSALELMDELILAAAEEEPGREPTGAKSALIIEFDGAEVDAAAAQAKALCREQGAADVRLFVDEEERERLWRARSRAISGLGRLAPSHATHDGVVPRTKLPEVQRRATEIARKHGLGHANVYHAGDGNLHPILLFDDADEKQVRAAVEAGREILELCLEAGGSITGEHGIGIEKAGMMDLMFDKETLGAMRRLKGCFDPNGRCNPGKVFPGSPHRYSLRPQVGH